MADIQITFSGPMFDGRAPDIIRDMATTCQHDAADAAMERWDMHMHETFRHPTGHYQSNINIAHREQDLVVNDRGVIYGFWLEGIGSRNSPVTRFPGYFNRRRTVQEIEQRVPQICQPAVTHALERINHG